MTYDNMVPGVFLRRPNRFVAHIEIDGQEEICHVKNTGRCRELLIPGVTVWCQRSHNPNRKTKSDLIAVQKGSRLINMDSQAPNAAAREWLLGGGLGAIENLRAETVQGDSRFDFSFTKDGKPCFLEVKGCTLEQDGVCRFPDAPTERGRKHLLELTAAARAGEDCAVVFVIQMAQAKYFTANDRTDPGFAEALRQAAAAGVRVLAYTCRVTPDSLELDKPLEVRL